jgi:hypothetical protein
MNNLQRRSFLYTEVDNKLANRILQSRIVGDFFVVGCVIALTAILRSSFAIRIGDPIIQLVT